MLNEFNDELTLEFFQAIFFKDIEKFKILSKNPKVNIYDEKFLSPIFIVGEESFINFYLSKDKNSIEKFFILDIILTKNINLIKKIIADCNITLTEKHFSFGLSVAIENNNVSLLNFFLENFKEFSDSFDFHLSLIKNLQHKSINTLKILITYCEEDRKILLIRKAHDLQNDEALLFLWNNLEKKSKLNKVFNLKYIYTYIKELKLKNNLKNFN
jgi:hypothetical protein